MAIARMECRARVEANNTLSRELPPSSFLAMMSLLQSTPPLLKLAINAHASTRNKLYVMETNFVPGGCDLFDQHRLCERDLVKIANGCSFRH